MGAPRNTLNRKAIQARKKSKDFKSRQGGISDEAWKGISKDERKEMAKAGLTQATGIYGWSGERDQAMESNSPWEKAAYEHGFGNVRKADELREVFQASKDIGISKMDSWNDARQFRRAHNDLDDKRFKNIEKKLGKQDSKPEPKPEPEKPKQEETVEKSDHYANAIATVNSFERPNIWGSGSSNASTDNQGDFGSSFMHRYKAGVKDNLEPTKPAGEDDKVYAGGTPGFYDKDGPGNSKYTPGSPSSKPSWQTW